MASTTFIDNQTTIYADWLNDVNSVVYDGVFQSSSITATSMICTGTASGVGFTNLINNTFASPDAIGSATPNTGAFTTLSATSLTATSITGLTTPLSRAQGGTGLSAAGTSGYVLTSDGTNWNSSIVPAVGVGQTWQSVTRTSGVTYTNTTGRPIIFQCSSTGNGQYLEIIVDGVRVAYTLNNGTFNNVSAVIPAGASYVINYNAAIQYPVELR